MHDDDEIEDEEYSRIVAVDAINYIEKYFSTATFSTDYNRIQFQNVTCIRSGTNGFSFGFIEDYDYNCMEFNVRYDNEHGEIDLDSDNYRIFVPYDADEFFQESCTRRMEISYKHIQIMNKVLKMFSGKCNSTAIDVTLPDGKVLQYFNVTSFFPMENEIRFVNDGSMYSFTKSSILCYSVRNFDEIFKQDFQHFTDNSGKI